MTAANPSPARGGDVSPCTPLHGWRLWVAVAVLASVVPLCWAADHHMNARRHAAHQGE